MKNQFKQVWGTANFPSHNAALRYYQKQDSTIEALDILYKVQMREIFIGRPTAKKHEIVFLNTEEERYFIGIK